MRRPDVAKRKKDKDTPVVQSLEETKAKPKAKSTKGGKKAKTKDKPGDQPNLFDQDKQAPKVDTKPQHDGQMVIDGCEDISTEEKLIKLEEQLITLDKQELAIESILKRVRDKRKKIKGQIEGCMRTLKMPLLMEMEKLIEQESKGV